MQEHILFETNHLIAANKPAGLLTQPSPDCDNSLQVMLKQMIKKRDQKPYNVFLEPIHRLDKPVSGIVIFAKTSKALSRLQKQVRERSIRKVYWALTDIKEIDSVFEWIDYLKKASHRSIVVQESCTDAKKAILKGVVISKSSKYQVVEINLVTGRYHQIRVQLASRNMPIVGDSKYGSKIDLQGKILLHHRKMMINDPINGDPIWIEAPIDSLWNHSGVDGVSECIPEFAI